MANIPTSFSPPKEWADYYFYDRGLAAIPAQNKHPKVGWLSAQDGVAPVQHEEWWLPNTRDYTMGFITGGACHIGSPNAALLVVDLDLKDTVNGLDTWRSWLELHNNGLDIETWEAKTPSGGRHLYFSVSREKTCPRNTQTKFKGIDIRGQGGFVMAPPSKNAQGQAYEWVAAPWDTPIEEAPQWLLETIGGLVQVGGVGSDSQTTAPRVETPSPPHQTDAFGNLIDGRDKKMADIAFAIMVNAYRLSPIRPTLRDMQVEAYHTYLQARPKTRLAGVENELGLDQEGRGQSAMFAKAERHWRNWDTTIKDAASSPPPAGTPPVQGLRFGEAAPAQGQAAPFLDNGGEPDDSRPFPVTEFLGSPPPRAWLWQDWLPAGSVGSLYGDGGIGKSLLAQQLAYSVASGLKFLGPRGFVLPQKRVMAAFCEDDRDELHRRDEDIVQSLGVIGVKEKLSQCYIWPRVGHDNLLVTFDKRGAPVMTAFFQHLANEALRLQTGFLILDTAADLFGGNENIRSEVNFFIKSVCGKMIKTAKDRGWELTVLILAHPSQSGKASGSGESGSTGWNNAVRSRMYLTKPEEGLSEQRTLTRMKSNYSSSGSDQSLDLIWTAGVLEVTGGAASTPDEHSKVSVEALRVEIFNLVKDAWERDEPYNNKNDHRRYVHKAVLEDLLARGYAKPDILEALKSLINGGDIEKVREKNKSGWRASFLSK